MLDAKCENPGKPFIFRVCLEREKNLREIAELSRKANNQTSWKANFCSSSPFFCLFQPEKSPGKIVFEPGASQREARSLRDTQSIFPFPAAQKSPEDGWWSSYRFDKVRMYWSAPDCTHTHLPDEIDSGEKMRAANLWEKKGLFSTRRNSGVCESTCTTRELVRAYEMLHLLPFEYQISQVIDRAGNTGTGRAIIYLWYEATFLPISEKNKRTKSEVRDGIGAKLVNW